MRMKLSREFSNGWLSALMCATCSLCCLSSAYAGTASWTVLLYLDGDNDLEASAITDFLEASDVGSSSDVNIAALFDRISSYSTSEDNWTDARRGLIQQGDSPTTDWGESIGEVNMGDPDTLSDFINWGVSAYPAEHYAVIIWNHGDGWLTAPENDAKSVATDTTSSDALSIRELRLALEASEPSTGPIDILGMDACLMSMAEVAYEIRNQADYYVASEETIALEGWPYDTILSSLVSTPSMTPKALAMIMVNRFAATYSEFYTLASIDLSQMDTVAECVDVLAESLRADWNGDTDSIVDAASDVQTAISNAVITERHSTDETGSNGLAIYLPLSGSMNSDYSSSNLQFAVDTQWDEFVKEYLAKMGSSWVLDANYATWYYDEYDNIDLYDFCSNLRDKADTGDDDDDDDTTYGCNASSISGGNGGPGDTGILAAAGVCLALMSARKRAVARSI